MQQRDYFGSLESLRGLAALIVFFYHIPAWQVPVHDLGVIRNGFLMVPFFFVLSGFVLMYSYGKKITSKYELRTFILLRLGRLYPVHFTFLLLFLLVEIAKYVAAVKFGLNSPNSTPFAENSIGAFFEHLVLIQSLGFTNHATAFNGPAWSISTEFYTYILFSVAILWLQLRNFIVLALGIVSVSLLLLIFFNKEIGDFVWILGCFAGFFSGCMVYTIYNINRERRLATGWSIAILITLAAFLSVKERSPGLDSLMLLLSALLILSLTLSPRSFINNFLDRPVLRWFGAISYSLYMTHLFVIWCANQIFRVLFKVPNTFIDGQYHPQLTVKLALFAYPLTIFFTIFLSWLVFRWIEGPFRRLTRRKLLPASSVLSH